MKPTVTCTYEEFKELQDIKESYEKLVSFIHGLEFEQENCAFYIHYRLKPIEGPDRLLDASDILYRMQRDLPSLIEKAIGDLYK